VQLASSGRNFITNIQNSSLFFGRSGNVNGLMHSGSICGKVARKPAAASSDWERVLSETHNNA
jgi:hypothetical protein